MDEQSAESKSPEVWFVRFRAFAECADRPLSTNPSHVWGWNRYLGLPGSVTPEAVAQAVDEAMDGCVRTVMAQIPTAIKATPNWTPVG